MALPTFAELLQAMQQEALAKKKLRDEHSDNVAGALGAITGAVAKPFIDKAREERALLQKGRELEAGAYFKGQTSYETPTETPVMTGIPTGQTYNGMPVATGAYTETETQNMPYAATVKEILSGKLPKNVVIKQNKPNGQFFGYDDDGNLKILGIPTGGSANKIAPRAPLTEEEIKNQSQARAEGTAAAKPTKSRYSMNTLTNTYYLDGNEVPQSSVPSDAIVDRFSPVDERQAIKDLTQYKSDALQALVAIDKIENGSKELGDFGRGAVAQGAAKAEMAYKEFAKDEKVTRYLGVVSQELIPMARKLMEEKGPITEFDVGRVEKGLGDPTTPLADKLFLLGELRNKVKAALENKIKQTGGKTEDLKTTNPDIYNRLYANQTQGSGLTPEEQKELAELEKKYGSK